MNLNEAERAQYEWQLWVDGFGEEGQRKLKAASVLVSRCGGVGGTAACELAAAGVGRIVLAHGGDLRPSDLNRQILMSHAGLGTSRVQQAAERLRALNPHIRVETVPENLSESNAHRLIADVDLVIDAAPLFEERFAMNRAAVALLKPMVECAMFALEAQCTTILPGTTACLACRVPVRPPDWKRQFPVFGAVAGMIGSLGAMEAIKMLAGFGTPLLDRLFIIDLRSVTSRILSTRRNPGCRECGHLPFLPKGSQEADGQP